jgi:hypothetical protein
VWPTLRSEDLELCKNQRIRKSWLQYPTTINVKEMTIFRFTKQYSLFYLLFSREFNQQQWWVTSNSLPRSSCFSSYSFKHYGHDVNVADLLARRSEPNSCKFSSVVVPDYLPNVLCNDVLWSIKRQHSLKKKNSAHRMLEQPYPLYCKPPTDMAGGEPFPAASPVSKSGHLTWSPFFLKTNDPKRLQPSTLLTRTPNVLNFSELAQNLHA